MTFNIKKHKKLNNDDSQRIISLMNNLPAPTAQLSTYPRFLRRMKAPSDSLINAHRSVGIEASPFRFFDLPPEIRNHIYGLSFSKNNQPINLALPVTPALARVCRQMREEFLPFFCSQAQFYLSVRSNLYAAFWPRSIAQARRRNDVAWDWIAHCYRDLNIKREATKVIQASKNNITFRHVTFQVRYFRAGADVPVTVLHMDVSRHKHIHVRVENRTYLTRTRFTHDGRRENIDRVLQSTHKEIEKLVNRTTFNGLTLRDLKFIALTFEVA